MNDTQTATLPGLEEGPAFATQQNVACVGLLWMPARIVDAHPPAALHVWLAPAPGGLPIFARQEVGGLIDQATAAELELQLEQIGTPLVVRGFGLHVAHVEGRECIRFGVTTLIQPVPAGDYSRSVEDARAGARLVKVAA